MKMRDLGRVFLGKKKGLKLWKTKEDDTNKNFNDGYIYNLFLILANKKEAYKAIEFKYEKLLVLEDQRSYKQMNVDEQWSKYAKLKKENIDYFKISKLALGFVSKPIAMKVNMNIFPYHKRGKKGYLLEDNAKELFSPKVKEKIEFNMANKNCKLCLFEDGIIVLPIDYFKIMRSK